MDSMNVDDYPLLVGANRSIRKADPQLLPEENSRNYSVTPQQSKPLTNFRAQTITSARKPAD